MGLPLFKENAKTISAPALLAAPPLTLISGTLQTFPIGSDPVQEILEDRQAKGSPYIDNSGREVLRVRNPAFELVDSYMTVDQKLEAERQENGGLTHQEAQAQQYAMLFHLYEAPTANSSNVRVVTPPPGHTLGATQVGRDGRKYIPVLDEQGKVAYFDDGMSCVMNKGGLAATTPADVNDDLIDDSQKFNITYKVDAKGNKTERSPEEANLQLALTRMDNEYIKLPMQLDMVDRIINKVSKDAANEASFGSSVSSGIVASITPSEPFSAAVTGTDAPAASKSIMFANKAPAPWAKAPEPAAPDLALR